MIGVVLQLSADTIDLSDSVWEQIASSLPPLFPALLFCLYPRTALMSLAALRDELERAAREKAVRKIQGFFRRQSALTRNLGRMDIASSAVVMIQLNQLNKTGALSLAGDGRKRQSACTDAVKYISDNRQRIVVTTAGSTSLLLGLLLMLHVSIATQRQAVACTQAVGAVAPSSQKPP